MVFREYEVVKYDDKYLSKECVFNGDEQASEKSYKDLIYFTAINPSNDFNVNFIKFSFYFGKNSSCCERYNLFESI
jgi:hypothetical protein